MPQVPPRPAPRGQSIVKPSPRNSNEPLIKPRQARRTAPPPAKEPTPPVESEDEAYGGSHDTDDEIELAAVASPEQNGTVTRSQSKPAKVTPRKVAGKVTNRSSINGKITGARNGQSTPRKAANGDSSPRKDAKGKGVRKPVKSRETSEMIAEFANDPTFGDEQRKLVQGFQKAYQKYQNAGESMPVEEEVNHLSTMAQVYKKSAVGTLNMYNLLRSSGLYNICLNKLEGKNAALREEIKDLLLSLEETAMRRVLKLKTTSCPLFAHDKKMTEHLNELQEIRDLCRADFANVLLCLRNLPSMDSVLKGKPPTERQMRAEDNIIATSAMMYAEVAARMRALLARILAECLELQGTPPCGYAMIGHQRLGSKDITPFEPIAVYLVIEKETAATKTYFRNTLTLLGMKILNLGETGITSLSIRSLNWYITDETKNSGLALANFIDDNEKKEFSVIPLDCIRTPKELAKIATSDKQAERDAIMHLVECATFITGDSKLFKELYTVRQAVLQRDQTEKDHKKIFFSRLKRSVSAADPFTSIGMKNGYEEIMRDNIIAFPKVLLNEVFDLEKTLLSESTINKLEEMMPLGSEVPYAGITIVSEVQDGITSTLSTRLEFPEVITPSPEPVRLPSITPYVPVPKKVTGTWRIEEEEEPRESVKIDNAEALKQLKDMKHKRRAVYSKHYQHAQRRAVVSQKINGKPPRSRNSTSVNSSPRTLSTTSKTTDISTSSEGSSKKNTETGGEKKGKKGSKKKGPTPEPIERLVTEVPVFAGKQKGILTEATSRTLVLLHCLTSAIKLSFNSDNQIATKHANRFKMDKKAYEATYVKILQVMVPLIEQLRQIISSGGAPASFKKNLTKLDLIPDDDEFVVALAYFHNKQYVESCKAMYKYLENRSDITFIGEPFPCDLTEVCQEMLEDNLLTVERYESLHVLMGHCQMRRKSSQEAGDYWTELLAKTTHPVKKAALYDNIHQCFLKLGRLDDAFKAVHRALSVYRDLKQKGAQHFDDDIERLRQIKVDLADEGANL